MRLWRNWQTRTVQVRVGNHGGSNPFNRTRKESIRAPFFVHPAGKGIRTRTGASGRRDHPVDDRVANDQYILWTLGSLLLCKITQLNNRFVVYLYYTFLICILSISFIQRNSLVYVLKNVSLYILQKADSTAYCTTKGWSDGVLYHKRLTWRRYLVIVRPLFVSASCITIKAQH